jgi:eukaryotic translation initiation factor 2C
VLCTIKRHHTRFFPEGSSSSFQDRAENPQPGYVVDSNVTLQNLDKFYLQSHAAIVGTARPTHYIILHNSLRTPIKDIQKMTFNLCYLYGRSVSSVGLVPAAFYADLVWDRARCYLRRAYVPFPRADSFNAAHYTLQPHDDVRDCMFLI